MDNKNIKKGYLLGTFVVRDNLEKVFNLLEKGFKVEKRVFLSMKPMKKTKSLLHIRPISPTKKEKISKQE